MKNKFKYFAIVWFVALVAFNAITFIVPADFFGVNRFKQSTFWIAYAFITLAFMAQLLSTYVVCNKDTAEKVFLSIPILNLGYSALSICLIVGVFFMIYASIPAWIGGVVCIAISLGYVFSSVKAVAVANAVSEVGDKVKDKTEFMKNAVMFADNVMQKATVASIKAEVKKAYEALRYSDYTSNEELVKIEVHIEDHLKQLQIAVESEDLEMTQTEVNELLLLINERNAKNKSLKNKKTRV